MHDVKERILTCARDIFLEEGMPHFSMRKVAQCVGVSATALYRHHANKEALLFQVLLRGFRIFADYLQRVDESQPPLDCLEATTSAYLDFALDEPGYYEMMFMSGEQMTGLKTFTRDGAREMQHTFAILQGRVQRAIEGGALRSRDSYETAFGIWAYAHGQISLFLNGRSGLARRTFVETYGRLMSGYLETL